MPANSLAERCQEIDAFFRENLPYVPDVAIVLGSGMSSIPAPYTADATISYSSIPKLKTPQVQTHDGKLIMARVNGINVAFFCGRIHLYEGHDLSDIAFFPLVVSLTGAKLAILTNLVGGVEEGLQIGDIVVLADHINLSGINPLIPLHELEGKPIFLDMYDAYSKMQRDCLHQAAKSLNIDLKEGVLAFFSGPNFETRAELEYIKTLGTSVVGWSVLPETLVARSQGMEVLGISCVSDLSQPDNFGPVDLKDIFGQGQKVSATLGKLLEAYLPSALETLRTP